MREGRCGGVSWWNGILSVVVLSTGITIALRIPAGATIKYGPVQISGNVETQNLIRHSSPEEFQFIQNRNTVRLRVDWDWLRNGQFVDKINVPFVKNSKLFLLYRAAYDGFYDIAPSNRQHGQTRFDDFVGGSITDLPGRQRDADKYENRLREAYVDLEMANAPVSFRLGRQQVVWGESDQFRMADIWNPLDLTWHFHQESWDNIRIPLWLAKGLWNIGTLGPLNTVFLEMVYNPFDFQPGVKAAFLPHPWGLPIPDPLRPAQVTPAAGVFTTPVFDLEGTSLRQGDFQRNPRDASEVGARFHFVTPQGVELSTNYLYGRGRAIGAAAPFAVKIDAVGFDKSPFATTPIGTYQTDQGNPGSVVKVLPLQVKARVMHPYMHIFGLTGNYSDADITESVLRFETAYAMGEPFQTTDPTTLVPITVAGRPAPQLGSSPLGFTKRDVWAGMIGFDRPTWIRWLNGKSTWFLSSQFFWSYTTGGHVDQLRGFSGAGDQPYFGPIGVWKTGPFTGKVERQQDGSFKGNGDEIRRWEHLVTLAASTFYRSGTVVPFVASAWDPINDNAEFLWTVDYFFTNEVIITLSQRFFTTYGSRAVSDDPWFVGRQARRDETGIKLTYQF